MSKKAAVVLVVVFLVFALLGYQAAAKIFPSDSQPEIQVRNNPAETGTYQNNYLLIHVDDLTQKSPRLISVWAAFIIQSNPPQITFLPLFPSLDQNLKIKTENTFKLNQDGSINSRFVTFITTTFDFETNGYILSDDTGIGYSNLWLTGQQVSYIPSISANSDELVQTVRQNGQTLYQQFCQLASSGSSATYFSSINWSQLLPDHFMTNIPFADITLVKDQIAQGGEIKCDVLASEQP